jgi:plastocyanin
MERSVVARAAAGLAVLVLAAPGFAGSVRGKVELLEKGGRRAADLEGVVVYLDGVKARAKPAVATMTMKGKSFIPRVVVIPVDGTVEFPNEDPILHNVFSVSGDNRFDLELYKKPRKGSWTFKHPGIARIYCNIHPQMSAVVLVRDNPYFAKASQDGSFVIEGVPAGKHTLKAWHERASEAVQEIVVPAEGEVAAQFVLDASSYRRVQHKNKHGRDYAPGEKY